MRQSNYYYFKKQIFKITLSRGQWYQQGFHPLSASRPKERSSCSIFRNTSSIPTTFGGLSTPKRFSVASNCWNKSSIASASAGLLRVQSGHLANCATPYFCLCGESLSVTEIDTRGLVGRDATDWKEYCVFGRETYEGRAFHDSKVFGEGLQSVNPTSVFHADFLWSEFMSKKLLLLLHSFFASNLNLSSWGGKVPNVLLLSRPSVGAAIENMVLLSLKGAELCRWMGISKTLTVWVGGESHSYT